MISGALLLPVRDTTGQFLKKRFTRVLFPFLLWSAFYTVFPWSYETLTGDSFHSVFPSHGSRRTWKPWERTCC